MKLTGANSGKYATTEYSLDKEASRTRDYCFAKRATLRAARPDLSLRKERLFRMTTKPHRDLIRLVRWRQSQPVYNT
jgi:hypothetical protein